ncbi:hypothetical protein LCGC14_1384130 [marine sediment metagenome]|uniref:Uncharacterized protein n=1 Tax=marine sediment metagenome TaxID=412755 RepID=A0A0F9K228_9ZZZZ
MDIKELVKWVARKLMSMGMCEIVNCTTECTRPCKAVNDEAKLILSHPNLALVIREGDEVPLGVETETHIVILLKEALKEANND